MSIFAERVFIIEDLRQALGKEGFTAVSVLSVIFVFIVLVVSIVSACQFIKTRREHYLRHEERLAMIDAGIHPDYPPEEEPDDLKKTTDYQSKREQQKSA